MHFHLFPPPPMPLMPMLLTAALAFALGAFLARCGGPQATHGMRDRFGQRVAFWRRSCQRSDTRHTQELRNSAFEDYRRATLAKLEGEAREFRTFLDGLRRAADAADFEAFLKSRRGAGEAS
jgi:hypothetical protein